MSDIQQLIDALVKFRDERDWAQFHDSKNLASAIGIEAAELNELFLWKTIKESEAVDRERIKEELADVIAYALMLANKHGIDVKAAVLEKIAKNSAKYPVEKAKGTATKYNEL
jgi:NTP pyrophosphatase (non-canonical NTP hydrolase)